MPNLMTDPPVLGFATSIPRNVAWITQLLKFGSKLMKLNAGRVVLGFSEHNPIAKESHKVFTATRTKDQDCLVDVVCIHVLDNIGGFVRRRGGAISRGSCNDNGPVAQTQFNCFVSRMSSWFGISSPEQNKRLLFPTPW
jgi:hypothetical protein